VIVVVAIIEQVRSYIVESFLLGDEGELTASDSLLESGVLDSTGVLELVAFLEQTFRIEVANEDLVPENLDSISNVASFVERKLQGSTPGIAKSA
jgi:acyl carrier protein